MPRKKTLTTTATRTETITSTKMLTATLALALANAAALATIPMNTKESTVKTVDLCPVQGITVEESCGGGKYKMAKTQCGLTSAQLVLEQKNGGKYECLTVKEWETKAARECNFQCESAQGSLDIPDLLN